MGAVAYQTTGDRMLNLTCSCCGAWCRGEQDPNQDQGYGTCDSCEAWIGERNAKIENEAIELIRDAFQKPENRARFEAMSHDEQVSVFYVAMEDGIITWKFGPEAKP